MLGTGLSNAGEVLLKTLEPRLAVLLAPLRDPPDMALAARGDRSGIIGAALYGGLHSSPTAGGSRRTAATPCAAATPCTGLDLGSARSWRS